MELLSILHKHAGRCNFYIVQTSQPFLVSLTSRPLGRCGFLPPLRHVAGLILRVKTLPCLGMELISRCGCPTIWNHYTVQTSQHILQSQSAIMLGDGASDQTCQPSCLHMGHRAKFSSYWEIELLYWLNYPTLLPGDGDTV